MVLMERKVAEDIESGRTGVFAGREGPGIYYALLSITEEDIRESFDRDLPDEPIERVREASSKSYHEVRQSPRAVED